MELFRLLGTIAVKNEEANKNIDETAKKAKDSESKISSAFEKIGNAIVKGFKKQPIDETNKSFGELTKTTSKQEKELKELKNKYADLYLTHGKNSKEARECALEIEKLSSELKDNKSKLIEAESAADKFDNSLKKVSEEAEKTESKIGNAFSKIGSVVGKIGSLALNTAKVVGAGVGVAATAIGALTKSALSSYADYEQLFGGIETLFGNGGKTLQEYADSVGKTVEEVKDEYVGLTNNTWKVVENAEKAFNTAGLSTNEYLETVTSFSASLIQSLNGDTVKAAEKADQAIVDMSDNANKMGSDMESIQNAYQGFAKQNYTMLDNLKLGYGGTQEEMKRLLNDAQAISGIEYDISSYADIVDAIHVIQTEMGITGTTAKEASTTISGSFNSMKASWQNLVTGFGNEDADLSGLIDQFTDSALTVVDNVVPRIEIILGGIADAIPQIIPKITSKLPEVLNSMLPPLIQGAVSLVNGLISALPSILQVLIEQVPFIVTEIAKALLQTVPVLISTANDIGSQIMTAINTSLSESDSGAFQGLVDAFFTLQAVVSDVFDNSIKPLFQDFVTMLQELWTDNQDILNKIGTLFSVVFETIGNLINPLVDSVRENMDSIKNYIQSALNLVSSILDLFIAVFTGDWKGMFDSVKNILESAKSMMKAGFEAMINIIISIVSKMTAPVVNAFNSMKTSISNKLNEIKTTVSTIFGNVVDAISEKLNLAKQTVQNGIEALKGFFNFEWKLPEIKLPHFKASGKFSLNPLSVPSFSIDWYKKAMDSPMLMNTPTAFGINNLGQIMAGGEAGSEVVSGTDTLMNMIASAVSAQNQALIEVLQKILLAILNMDEDLYKKFSDALESASFTVNDREFGRLVRKAVL